MTATTSTRTSGLVIVATACAIVVTVIFLTNWPVYNMDARGGIRAHWFYLLPGVMILPIVFAEPSLFVRYFREPLLWWFVAYVFLGLLWLGFAQDFIEHASEVWWLRMRVLFFFYTLTILFTHVKRPLLVFFILCCVFLAGAFDWLDAMRPYRFVPQGLIEQGTTAGRGAGMFMNPNVAASFIAAGTIAALPFVPMRYRALILVVAMVGIAPTSSRSGFLYIGVATLGAIVCKLLDRKQAVLIIFAVPVLLISAAVQYDTLMKASDVSDLDRVVQRLSWFEAPEEEDASVRERKAAAAHAMDMFLEEPLTGHGTGATSQAIMGTTPHNMYVMLLAEQGVLGLVLYLALIGIMYTAGRRLMRASGDRQGHDIGASLAIYAAFLVAYGFFSNNVLEEHFGIFMIAFITTAAFDAARRVPMPIAASVVRPAHGESQSAFASRVRGDFAIRPQNGLHNRT